ncbi:NrfD/PsrC family molybdoenzyme membrane anchor subunit [Pelotomaculum propionicicum]|uniref:Putative Ni/Fe-hydrogenase 2 b-type cytochrome subunit n=1 Tax=Pelotomaculum propionicicum TaxID=258475 RepID=A0A4Y7RSU4_9FIRM|nr:Ni/Fe-hydrogenase cytochrome b subunit [Pelotomaculum propionicicum]TEB12055.1 putative Ni/Fe-hydrogenase 2 b-type cytochrome subunit [Pelotomaculum propionicicum]
MSKPRNWSFRITWFRLLLICFVIGAVIAALYRFYFGLGSVTHLSDRWPWGLWIGFDLLCGIALAGGGFSTALIVHVLHKDKYLPIARAALLTSMIGYIISLISLFLDIGRWYNFWRPFFYWGFHSVLFEVFWCISLYTTVQVLEFGDIFFEKVNCPSLKKILGALMTPLLILGIVLPSLHQSSLGSLYIVAVDKLNPLWWSMLIPFFFVWSAFFLGPAMVTIEGTLAARAYRREAELPVFQSLTKVTLWMMIIYFIVKIIDLNYRGVMSQAFNGSYESNMFLIEMIVFVLLPIFLYAIPAIRTKLWGVVTASVLVVAGVVFNRMNVVFTGMAKSVGGSYFPSFWEFLITIGMWSFLILFYCFVVENFPILPKEEYLSHESSIPSKPGVHA